MTDHSNDAVAPAKPPVGVGATPLVAQLLALGLVALGVVGVQDLLARTGLIAQAPWTDTAVSQVDGLASDSVWVLVGGIVAALLGLVVLATALRRRPRKTLELDAQTGVRLRTRDLPRLLQGTVETVDGVTDVDVRASRRSVRVVATTVVRDERRREVATELEERIAPTLRAPHRAPRPRIKLKEGAS
ncbi:DUF6286 domain-containing protein [Nocardioides aequoreus]|uniref:DUF6286 domain-containing protein n=1 Tax=Nocardioides aequoreus TaxID=397278 RepID=UPI0006921762|nr:DUF6286 domain-containing protein [Nocardioides aequoreus]